MPKTIRNSFFSLDIRKKIRLHNGEARQACLCYLSKQVAENIFCAEITFLKTPIILVSSSFTSNLNG